MLQWFRAYLVRHAVRVSAVTVLERLRGFDLALAQASPERRREIQASRVRYLHSGAAVLSVDVGVAVVGAGILALLSAAPSPPRQSHRRAESRPDRIARWRFDVLIAATALTSGLTLVHENPADFEAIRAAIERSPERFPGLGPLELVRVTRLA